ncbi:hypothetical protein J3R82DRAFT_2945 [Butyriboletus roseoflavus]|nr:hypothetical protein J3R82DRAFT_2945 [Butyriboletus roseoflavus]
MHRATRWSQHSSGPIAMPSATCPNSCLSTMRAEASKVNASHVPSPLTTTLLLSLSLSPPLLATFSHAIQRHSRLPQHLITSREFPACNRPQQHSQSTLSLLVSFPMAFNAIALSSSILTPHMSSLFAVDLTNGPKSSPPSPHILSSLSHASTLFFLPITISQSPTLCSFGVPSLPSSSLSFLPPLSLGFLLCSLLCPLPVGRVLLCPFDRPAPAYSVRFTTPLPVGHPGLPAHSVSCRHHFECLSTGKQAEHLQVIASKQCADLQVMSIDEQDVTEQMFVDHGTYDDEQPPVVPIGEEAFGWSHEGGKYEAFDNLAEQMMQASGHHHVDPHTHADCVETQSHHWNTQMDCLVSAYLDYQSRDSGDGMPSEVDPLAPPMGEGDGSIVGIELVDMFNRHYETFITPACNQYPNETLIHHGYLGCSLLYPTIAISLHTLAAFRQQHRVCPRFSIQAQVKSLCHLHEVPYRPSLTTALSVAYDAYLEILKCVDQELKKALQ